MTKSDPEAQKKSSLSYCTWLENEYGSFNLEALKFLMQFREPGSSLILFLHTLIFFLFSLFLLLIFFFLSFFLSFSHFFLFLFPIIFYLLPFEL
jgi:hypothetical protein